MHDDASDNPKHSTSPKAKVLDTCKRTKHQKEAHQLDAHKNLNDTNQENSKRKKRSCDDEEKQKTTSIESTQEDNINQIMVAKSECSKDMEKAKS